MPRAVHARRRNPVTVHALRDIARGGVGPVVRRTVFVPAPSADTGTSLTPEAGKCWLVESYRIPFVTSSHSANRNLLLTLNDGNENVWTIPTTATQAASLTYTYDWIAGYYNPNTTVVGTYLPMGLPPTILYPGWSLTLGFVNDDTADQVNKATAVVLEALVGATEAEYNLARTIEHRAMALAEVLADEVQGA